MEEVNTEPAKHIFLDVVGFTRNRDVVAQARIVELLNGLVSSCLEQHEITEDDSILLPTGDGLCITLLSVETPHDIHIRIALDILKELHRHNIDPDSPESHRFEVRIGINDNTDILVLDINNKRNIAGAGINGAQRVMSLADGGQVLVSSRVYENLRYWPTYINAFDQHSGTVKHGERMGVYQLKLDRPGLNVEVPSAFKPTPKPLKPQEPRLPRVMAYYLAHAIANQQTILEKDLSNEDAVILLLYMRAKDSEEEADATQFEKLYPDTYKAGKASFEEQYKEHYSKIDRGVVYLIHRFMSDTYFFNDDLPLYKCFHQTSDGVVDFRFANDAGRAKLKKDWPQIWEQFELGE